MKPPWIRFPAYQPHCLGWRMGGGEDYLERWFDYLSNLTADQLESLQKREPPPQGFEYLYPSPPCTRAP